MILLALLFPILVHLIGSVDGKLFGCGTDNPFCLNGLFNDSTALGTFLGDEETVVFQNDVLKNGSACAVMTVLFARGTDEPGNVGILTGPPFFAALAGYMNGTGKLAIQGVDYPADTPGFLAGGSPIGAHVMYNPISVLLFAADRRRAALVNSTLAACPKTLLTLAGYSQGAQVVHLAAAQLPANTTSQISSVVLFGDPRNGTAVTGVDSKRVLTICHEGDNVCAGGTVIDLAHLNYSGNALQGAMFALNGVARVGITSERMRLETGGGIIS